MQSCLHNKYVLTNDTLKLINYAQDPCQWLSENTNKLVKPHLKLKNKIIINSPKKINENENDTMEIEFNNEMDNLNNASHEESHGTRPSLPVSHDRRSVEPRGTD